MIPSKYWPPWYLRNILSPLFKKFSKMAAILNFRIFSKNVKMQIYAISLTVRDRAISSKFSIPGCLRNILSPLLKKCKKWRPFWIFKFSPKMQKRKIYAISLTVRERAISSKFSIPGCLRNILSPLFKKFSKMVANLNF